MSDVHAALRALRNVTRSIQLPPGIEDYDPAWEMMVEVDQRLVDSYKAVLEEDCEESRDQFRAVAKEWKERWVLAIEDYRNTK